jgi:hypothetical protein
MDIRRSTTEFGALPRSVPFNLVGIAQIAQRTYHLLDAIAQRITGWLIENVIVQLAARIINE